MKGGFTFCGTDIADLNLEYAPEMENTYVYSPAEEAYHIESYDGHNGGYGYGSWKKPKEFILRCIFEEKVIDRGIAAQIHSLFKVGKSGKLVFKRRPWCYYYATVTEPINLNPTNYLNGMVTVRMKAMYPFGRGQAMNEPYTEKHLFYNLRTDPFHDIVMTNTALYETEEMVPAMSFTDISTSRTVSLGNHIVLGNPGAERAHVAVVAAGDAGTGIVIDNKTTGQQCKLIAMSKALTTEDNKRLVVDGINGKTVLYDTVEKTSSIAFLYHDFGYIELEPGYPAVRDLYATYDDQKNVYFTNIVYDDIVGKYVYLNEKWIKIVDRIDEHNFRLANNTGAAGSNKTMAMLMNEIEVRAVSTMDLTHLSFIYKPTFS